jgi:hypothetical protein
LSASADIVSDDSTRSPTAAAEGPPKFQQLNYFENFNAGWVAKGGHTILHYRANGFINGYVGAWQSDAKVDYFFSPDDWIARGRLVSAFVLILTVAGFLVSLMSARSQPSPPTHIGK